MDLKAQVLDWIDRKVPYHSQRDYRLLLEENERLALRLISAEMALEGLQEYCARLEDEIGAMIPLPTIVPRLTENYDPYHRETVFHMDFSPVHARVATRASEDVLRRYGGSEYVQRAFQSYFDRQVVPLLKQRIHEVIQESASRHETHR